MSKKKKPGTNFVHSQKAHVVFSDWSSWQINFPGWASLTSLWLLPAQKTDSETRPYFTTNPQISNKTHSNPVQNVTNVFYIFRVYSTKYMETHKAQRQLTYLPSALTLNNSECLPYTVFFFVQLL